MATYEPTIRIYANATGIRKALEKIVNRAANFPQRRQRNLDRIMRDGIMENVHALSYGGDVRTPGGMSIKWTTARHWYTKKVRRSFFGDSESNTFPLLRLTGKLQSNLPRGSIRATPRAIRYRVPREIADLVRVHQQGGRPLPSSSGRRAPADLNIPPRQILMWSREMAIRVLKEGRDALREGGAR